MAVATRLLSLACLGLLIAAGCQSREGEIPSAVATEWREKLLVANRPADGRPLVEVRQELASLEEGSGGHPVIVSGTIGSMPNPYSADKTHEEFPWMAEEASFFLVDEATVAEFKKHGHAKGEECPYCLKLASTRSDRIAKIQIVDAQGAPVPYRADLLLGLKEGDRVVVSGDATLHLETLMVLEPDAIYVDTAADVSQEESSQPLSPAESEQ